MVGEQQLEIGQVICWDRGRPSPQMSAKRENWIETATSQTFAPAARLRAGRPRSQQVT